MYVDDIILTGDDVEELNQLKKVLATEFEMKDLGKLKYFLCMEIARSATEIARLKESTSLIVKRNRDSKLQAGCNSHGPE